MALPVIVTRVRATLHREGYQGFTKEQIIEVANTLSVDINSPTPEGTKAVANHLIQISKAENTGIEVAEENLVNKNLPEEVNQDMLDSLPVETAITPSQKNQMVASQAQLMGLVLAESDIQNIAQQVDFQASDSNELIDEIKGLLVAFINYRESQTQMKVSQAFSEIINHANASNKRVSESLHTGLQSLAEQMEEQRNHFKSSVRSSLRYFAIPGSETYE